ncbi:MAG TPA: glycosyltransferase [Acidobacteriota bacterium]|nr:glycosyltransferase [Acidobacteriota bacterium]
MDPLTFSLVIPARNEEAYLPRLLDTVEVARQRYRGGPDSIEVIVADNVSTDRTAQVALERGCRVARVEKRIIAAVRNGGAALATREILAFVDADMQIHPETFNEIEKKLAEGKTICGATGARVERWSTGLLVTYAFLMILVLTTNMDTGVVFCRRADFEAMGGYNEKLILAEDVQFLWDMRRLGKKRGQKLSRATTAKAIASVRKFDTFGQWHFLSQLPRAAYWKLFAPDRFVAFADKYWYGDGAKGDAGKINVRKDA